MRLRATWADGVILTARVRRNWLWPFSRNVTFGATIFEGGPVGMNAPTTRHELQHVRQYHDRGWWWVWTHPRQREAEAHAMEAGPWPVVEIV